MLRNKKKAFTITELVIVIAVIAILAAVLIPTFSNVIASAKQSKALQQCKNALTEYNTTVTTDDDPNNDNSYGMVFLSEGHAFVHLNNQLHYLGTLTNNENIVQLKNEASNSLGELKGISLPADVDLSGTATIQIKVGKSTDVNKELTMNSLAPTYTVKVEEEGEEVDKQVPYEGTYLFYLYNIELNGTTYAGCFLINTDVQPTAFEMEGVSYASYIAYSAFGGENLPTYALTITKA